MKQIFVDKGRTTILSVSLGYDISGDTFASQIREEKSQTSELIATWTPSFEIDGTDGELILTLDNSISSAITHSSGFMDIKRTTGGQPIAVFDGVLEVIFNDTVTV